MQKYPPTTSIADLPNLGQKSAERLGAVGIYSLADLQEVGEKEVYARLRARFGNVSICFLYAIIGALSGFRWNNLPPPLLEWAREIHQKLILKKCK